MRSTAARSVALVLSLIVALALPTAASGRSEHADLRVVTSDGTTLADYRQYADDVRVRASEKADCFGPDNPSSNRRYRLEEPNPLGVLAEAANHSRSLSPLRLTDAFVDDGFGFGVCSIGGFETVGFAYWYLAVNRVGATTGPDLVPMESGDRHLWYLTKGTEPGFPNELVLRAPARVEPGVPFEVRVVRFAGDGSSEPAAGALVTNGLAPTGPDGRTTAVVTDGFTRLQASGADDDVPSSRVAVCASETPADCPAARGLRIFGSAGDDRIRATRGPDVVRCRRGDDVVLLPGGGGGDRIAGSCERKVRR
jgi:hypothetical protein